MRFIKVTRFDGETIYVRADRIVGFGPHTSGAGTFLSDGTPDEWRVHETPEQILELLTEVRP